VYDLVANVIHESAAGTTRDKESTIWKVHLRAGSGGGENEKWFQIQDLIVEEIRKEMIFLGETILQVSTATSFGPYTDVPCRYGSVERYLPTRDLSDYLYHRTGCSVCCTDDSSIVINQMSLLLYPPFMFGSHHSV
jgi:hypothetical protein